MQHHVLATSLGVSFSFTSGIEHTMIRLGLQRHQHIRSTSYIVQTKHITLDEPLTSGAIDQIKKRLKRVFQHDLSGYTLGMKPSGKWGRRDNPL